MAAITFGGGPKLESRMQFCNLKEGTQVPGYRGYIPHLKYAIGKTYGTDTHELSQSYTFKHPLMVPGPGPKPPLKNILPGATGDNKLTEKMVPGYTGYIPRKPFKYGDTFKVDCDYSIDEHLTNRKKHDQEYQALSQATRSSSRLQPIKHDPTVRDHLNTYRDAYPGRPILMDDKRAPTEPPIPGYQGYIPRINQTELGLGNRYHTTTRLGFEEFYANTKQQASKNNEPIDIKRATTDLGMRVQAPAYSKRIYPNSGMIPKYTGYVPQRRYQFGNTYGDTTRSLEVCAHPKDSFGDFTRSQPKTNSSFVC